jgi:putative transcriptional regulator
MFDIGRGVAGAALLLAAALGLGAIDPAPPDAPAPAPPNQPGTAPRLTPSDEPPAGQLLIASAQIQDPRFYHSVILILHHDKDGAFGIVINDPVGDKPVKDLLDAAGDKDDTADGTILVLSGGPVEPQYGFVVHSAEYHRAETLDIDGKVAMTASKQTLRDIGHHQGPTKYFFAFGYAGWGAGQLEGEMARQDWFTAPEDLALLFDEERGAVWDKALARRGREL